MKRKVLGKGLGALIPRGDEKKIGGEEIPLTMIRESSLQPRKDFNPDSLKDLERSIREKGVIQPVVVRRVATGYELIAGERRLRAARLAGLLQIPAVVRNSTEEEAFELALIENVQREDLNPMEIAEAYSTLAKEYGLSQEEIAQKVGKERSTVSNFIRLLRLPLKVTQAIREEKISLGHAKVLLGMKNEEGMERLFSAMIEKEISVREAERLSRSFINKTKNTHKTRMLKVDPNLRNLLDSLERKLGSRVRIRGTGTRGVIEIPYGSARELEGIIQRIKG